MCSKYGKIIPFQRVTPKQMQPTQESSRYKETLCILKTCTPTADLEDLQTQCTTEERAA